MHATPTSSAANRVQYAPFGATPAQVPPGACARLVGGGLLVLWRYHRYNIYDSRRRAELEGERPLLEVGRGGSRPPAILMLTARVRTGFHVQEVGMCAGAPWGGGGVRDGIDI